jgi:adenylylsulfate kinase
MKASDNTTWHAHAVDKPLLEKRLGQKGGVLWMTGLSGSGKSTIANALAQRLYQDGHFAYVLDGDNVRHGLCGDLGFSTEDRNENVRRVAHVARLFADAGIIAIVALISPTLAQRQMAREIGGDNFLEVFVKADLSTCEGRDPKGLYKKARAGQIPEFTGLTSPYEAPTHAELVLNTDTLQVEAAVERLLAHLQNSGIVGGASA